LSHRPISLYEAYASYNAGNTFSAVIYFSESLPYVLYNYVYYIPYNSNEQLYSNLTPRLLLPHQHQQFSRLPSLQNEVLSPSLSGVLTPHPSLRDPRVTPYLYP